MFWNGSRQNFNRPPFPDRQMTLDGLEMLKERDYLPTQTQNQLLPQALLATFADESPHAC
jgi:hypothetical protein